jgi:thiol-disulfide isomerase/thioredoxin
MKTSFFILSTLLIVSASGALAATSPADTMLNTPAPAFTLKDINGKTVTLADYKGKVLIIDFWATWCGPCKSSFPSVKKVIEQYKQDPKVSFLFIDTREKDDNYPELVKKFLADNKYPFHVVYDEKGQEGKMDKVYKQYVMPGIPTKYIIDAKGIIRYQIVGFMPGKTDEEAAKEFTQHIEAVKKIS